MNCHFIDYNLFIHPKAKHFLHFFHFFTIFAAFLFINNQKRMKKKIFGIAISILILIIGGGALFFYQLFYTPIFNIQEDTRIFIDEDDTADSVRQKITENCEPKDLQGFDILAKYYNYYNRIKTGCYTATPKDNACTFVRKLNAGWQTPVNIIVPSVRTIDRMAEALSNQLMINKDDIINYLTNHKNLKELGFNQETLPSLFIPNTYEMYWNCDIEKLMTRLKKEYKRFWDEERIQKARSIGLSPNEVVTLASIVDEETANNKEKPIVAGLYINRLKRNIHLQADHTIKFALQDFTLKRIYNKHLKIESPYNTYLHPGLPIGPIRIPSIAGIESVLNYAKHDYIYMCAKEDFSGTHNFAKTLSEHNANARRYQQALNQRGIR